MSNRTLPDLPGVTVLRAAKARLADPARWGKGGLCLVIAGNAKFCAAGALLMEGSNGQLSSVLGLLRFLDIAAQRRGFPGIVHLNDSLATKHETIMQVYDEAIALAEAEAQLVLEMSCET